jgi:hypothetical protein
MSSKQGIGALITLMVIMLELTEAPPRAVTL